MIGKTTLIIAAAVISCLFATGALAQSGTPKGSAGGGAITIEQLTKLLEPHIAEKFGIVVHFVLPKGWELVEQGVDPKSGKMVEGHNRYVLLSRRPMDDPKEPTDFIFELSIFEHPLDVGSLSKDASAEELRKALGEQLSEFLNVDMSDNLRAKFDLVSKPSDIKAKEYRKGTYFVPIRYKSPEGSMLYTFTSFEGKTIYQLKFLVSEDMVDQHGMLIALMLRNSFALTDEMHKELLKQQAEASKGAKPKT